MLFNPQREAFARTAWLDELRATLTLGAPLVLTNLAQIALTTTDVIVLGRLDPLSEAETLQRAAAAQARYKFRFDVSKLVTQSIGSVRNATVTRTNNAAPVAPEILAAIAQANEGAALAYGNDVWTKRVEQSLAALFEHEVAVFLVPTGTAANALKGCKLGGPASRP